MMRSDGITNSKMESPFGALEGRAMEEAIRLACIRLGRHQAGLFARGEDSDFIQRWEVWTSDEWPRFEAYLHRAYRAAVNFQFEGVLEVDGELASLLSSHQESRQRSQALARLIVDSTSGAKGRSLLNRFGAAINAGSCEGHGLTAFSLHMVLFHVPLLHTTLAYLYDEWRSALDETGQRAIHTTVESFFWRYPGLIQRTQHRLNQHPQPLQIVQHG